MVISTDLLSALPDPSEVGKRQVTSDPGLTTGPTAWKPKPGAWAQSSPLD